MNENPVMGNYWCRACNTVFYTEDGLARHYCADDRIKDLISENNRLRSLLKSIKIIASEYVGDSHDRREGDGGADSGSQ